ncbi:hypothetical protein PHMEG_00010894 [Phytophthora megakarya]|uniref:Uncharacterized protein n=1 Tax=Phytophthora megakarya TaxID=4795 RepID=A0A225WD42_9STRA|nr:hypothetical protein PHMEG_00010894 [Phytophthora megakarya]
MVNNPIHLAVDRTADRVMFLSAVLDAHHMVNPRLTTALESVRASQIAELRQQLNVQKAYVAEAAQTTSNIRVEVSDQVRLLREKVKRLEEKLRTGRASSSTRLHD